MKTIEERLLSDLNIELSQAAYELLPSVDITDARLDILELVSNKIGGWDNKRFRTSDRIIDLSHNAKATDYVKSIVKQIQDVEIPDAFAVSALSREVLPKSQQRKTGAYYTDWRLATLLAQSAISGRRPEGPWIDPACGSGTLLVAATLQVSPGESRDSVIRNDLAGADLSPNALRGALLSIGCLTSNTEALESFSKHLYCQDSLQAREMWRRVVSQGAGLIIGNPPWEKLKLSRHEYAMQNGESRNYGETFTAALPNIERDKADLLDYIQSVANGTALQGKGEHDLYKLFLELGLGLTSSQGTLALILPAGLFRAKGTEELRRAVLTTAKQVTVLVSENRPAYFAIDSRFKFVLLIARMDKNLPEELTLKVANRTGEYGPSPVVTDLAELELIRPDLSLPEVRSSQEWELYKKLATRGVKIGDKQGPWHPNYCREIDMTSDRATFITHRAPDAIPLIEGRHIGQYRSRAKLYLGGEGRAASWQPQPINQSRLQPHWYVRASEIKRTALERSIVSRIGFCDITGQTNERTFIAARIPAGVVCGNKVPTLDFGIDSGFTEDLFLALANSVVVDWMIRRVITTTANFFLLNGLHLPNIDLKSTEAKELVSLARALTQAEGKKETDLQRLGILRARIDAIVANIWGLSNNELELVISDFPLLDRGQPTLPGESRSTVTADLILAEFSNITHSNHASIERSVQYRRIGAAAYVPAQHQTKGNF